MESAKTDGNAVAGYDAGLAVRILMLARLYANRFLIENGQEQLDRVAKELAEFRQNNQSLAGALQSGSRQSQALVALIDTYEAAFADVSKLIFHRNAIIAERLDPVGLQAAADLESVQAAEIGRAHV